MPLFLQYTYTMHLPSALVSSCALAQKLKHSYTLVDRDRRSGSSWKSHTAFGATLFPNAPARTFFHERFYALDSLERSRGIFKVLVACTRNLVRNLPRPTVAILLWPVSTAHPATIKNR